MRILEFLKLVPLTLLLFYLNVLNVNGKGLIGTYELNVQKSLVDDYVLNQPINLTWVSTRKAASPFVLVEGGKGVKCTKDGAIKVETTVTVVVKENASSVLLCLDLQGKDKYCQPCRISNLEMDTTFPLSLDMLYDVEEGDIIQVSVVGGHMLKRVTEYNRLIMYYL